MSKYNWDIIEKTFNDRGYILLSSKEEYKNVSTKLKYICKKHIDKGEMMINAYHLMSGEGCMYCGRERTAQARRLPFTIDEDKELSESKNFEYIRSRRQNHRVVIDFICNNHRELGEQTMVKANMQRDIKGCKFCSGKNIPAWYYKKTLSEINPNIELLEEPIGSNTRIRYRCTLHNIESATNFGDLLRGTGCIKCGRSKNYKEDEMCDGIENAGFKIERQKKIFGCKDIRDLPFDCYLPDYNIAIEYDGEQHYRPVNFAGMCDDDAIAQFNICKSHDAIKNKFCSEHGITLIRVPYTEKNPTKHVLDELEKIGVYNRHNNT